MGQCPSRRARAAGEPGVGEPGAAVASGAAEAMAASGDQQGDAPASTDAQALSKSKRKKQGAKAKRAGAGGDGARALKVCGPAKVHTLRGRLFGREVALVCCSEAHEDAMDLTRKHCVTQVFDGWIESDAATAGKGLNVAKAWKKKSGVTLKKAMSWAEEELDDAEDEDEDSEDEDAEDVEKDGALLAFVADSGGGQGRGSAYIFLAGCERHARSSLPAPAKVFEWGDFDDEAREYCRARRASRKKDVEVHDALIAARKAARLEEGVEFFDDWAIRQAGSEAVHVEVVLEAPVPAAEVELHTEAGAEALPPAHECLRRMEPDSESDSDDEHDGGSDAYIDYLRRRLEGALPRERVHCIDPRELGEGSEEQSLRDSFQALLKDPLPEDAEVVELNALGASEYVSDGDDEDDDSDGGRRRTEAEPPAVPSWEAFFGAGADVLYYHPETKIDYTPFLAKCVGSTEALQRFFEALFFGTVPEALALLTLDAATLPFARIRSAAYRQLPSGKLFRRRHPWPPIPVRAAPVGCFLKARGSEPPRTWVSGLAARLAASGAAGAEAVVAAARTAFGREVALLLADPKTADREGDYFEAWLREVHPEIYEDIDTHDPAVVVAAEWMPSEEHPKSKKHRHYLRDIRIPDFKSAFAELLRSDLGARVSTRRERVLAKILVDAFMLRLVDLAAVLKMADAILNAPAGKPVVLVAFLGGDHANLVADFWLSQGFSSKGLPAKGIVGKDDWEEDEPRGLEFPSCLLSLGELFPATDPRP